MTLLRICDIKIIVEKVNLLEYTSIVINIKLMKKKEEVYENMLGFVIGVITGVIAGVVIGVGIMCIIVTGSRSEKMMDDMRL